MSFYEWDHRYMLDVMDAHPGMFSAVGLVDHRSPEVAAAMKRLEDRGVRGFRLHSRGDAQTWVQSKTRAQLSRFAAPEVCLTSPAVRLRSSRRRIGRDDVTSPLAAPSPHDVAIGTGNLKSALLENINA